jgi:hypothetical protein
MALKPIHFLSITGRAVRHMRWLDRLCDRMQRHGVAVDDPVMRAAVNARNAMHSLRIHSMYGAGANGSHGLKRTNEDKRRAVMCLLEDEEWSGWSNSEIARRCGVNHHMVAGMRPSLGETPSEARTYTTKHGTTATMNTANIGRLLPGFRFRSGGLGN